MQRLWTIGIFQNQWAKCVLCFEICGYGVSFSLCMSLPLTLSAIEYYESSVLFLVMFVFFGVVLLFSPSEASALQADYIFVHFEQLYLSLIHRQCSLTCYRSKLLCRYISCWSLYCCVGSVVLSYFWRRQYKLRQQWQLFDVIWKWLQAKSTP